ncbi:MAG: hypothetical protein K1X89_08090 [Myxococcaceae bacterium]|nr:hypothetical protein [Myxococcaceae bacterium]
MRWFAALPLVLTGCQCVATDGLTFGCEADGGCPAGRRCDAPSQLCLPADAGQAADGGPEVDAGVDAGADAGGVDAGKDAGVDAGADAGLDAGPMPSGETCDEPFPLDLAHGEAVVTGTLVGAKDDVLAACAPSQAPDLVYAFDGGGVFTASVDRLPDSGIHPQLMVRSTCAGTSAELCVQCSCDVGGRVLLAPGRWFVVVDSRSGLTGPYALHAALVPAVSGESCDFAASLALLDGGFSGTISLAGTIDERQRPPSCSPGDAGHDLVVKFVTPRAGNLGVTASAPFTHALALTRGTACATATEVLAACDAADAGPAAVAVTAAPAGTYWLWLSSPEPAQQGALSVTITLD